MAEWLKYALAAGGLRCRRLAAGGTSLQLVVAHPGIGVGGHVSETLERRRRSLATKGDFWTRLTGIQSLPRLEPPALRIDQANEANISIKQALGHARDAVVALLRRRVEDSAAEDPDFSAANPSKSATSA